MPRQTTPSCGQPTVAKWSIPLLAFLALATPAHGEPDLAVISRPAFLVEPYLQLPAPGEMTVMWETNQRLRGRVEYGTTTDLGRVVQEAQAALLHEVRLTGLKPATVYYYRVRCGDLASERFSFRSPPLLGTRRWRMALYGDSRTNPLVHRRVVEQIRRANVDLVVHTGDIVTDGKNHPSWRREFFEPVAELARSVPWVSTIGNHERDSDNYFSYMALPGNEHYFGIDFANAHVICLDSNAWIEKGRDSPQYHWLTEHLRQKRDATWTFVVFHHPLFSAHATRPILPLRWDWAPVLLDPANHVDGVLTGHDHFYARNYRMGRLSDRPAPGVLFLTSAGGGASLYRTRRRDYVAAEQSVHHFTLFEFDGDRVTISAIGVAGGLGRVRTGEVIDRYVLTKEPTPDDEFCAYEIEEFRDLLRKALAATPPIRVGDGSRRKVIRSVLRVPTRFAVPVRGQLIWERSNGWKLGSDRQAFSLRPGQPLEIPLEAEIDAHALAPSPRVTVAFEPGRFRNRTVEVYPFKLAGPHRVPVAATEGPLSIDGKLDGTWEAGPAVALLAYPPHPSWCDEVHLLADRDWLYVGARLHDPERHVRVKPADADTGPSSLVRYFTHFRVETWDGRHRRSFALSPEHLRYTTCDREEDESTSWRSAAGQGRDYWTVEMALPRRLFPDLGATRINLVYRCSVGREWAEFHLCPTYKMGSDPDRLPDWKPTEGPDDFAQLSLEGS
jgi:hypothetical protein